MAIRQRGGKWHVEIRCKGRPDIYKTFDTKIEAQRFEAEQKILLKSGKHVIRRTLYEAMERYSLEIAPKHEGERWEQVRINKFKRDAIADDYVDMITPDDIEAWIRLRTQQGLADASILRELSLLSAIFRECVRWKYCLTNPVRDASKPPEGQHRVRRYEDWEIEDICEALQYSDDKPIRMAKQAMAVAFLFAIETGMRQGEIFRICWKDVNLDHGYVFVPKSKNGDSRNVPLTERAEELLRRMVEVRGHRRALRSDAVSKEAKLRANNDRVWPYNQKSCATMFRDAVKLAGVEDATFHDSRHEACSRMANIEGMTPLELGKIIGHRDLNSLMIYFNPHARDLVKAVRKPPKW